MENLADVKKPAVPQAIVGSAPAVPPPPAPQPKK
jgi:hypothetical protein